MIIARPDYLKLPLMGLLALCFTFTACEDQIDPDEPCAERTWYQDADNDGKGNPDVSILSCEQPTGYVANSDDDNDMCMDIVDECGVCGGPGAPTWYEDADGDSLGNPNVSITACEQPEGYVANDDDLDDTINDNLSAIERAFGDRIDLDNLYNYANQPVPNYINKDNTTTNPITDAGATLGRVLFYDKALSVDNTIACASCHQQAAAFSDNSLLSQGVAGLTGRHSMRLINARFADERRFFWDERADDLEFQVTQPIQDHVEMGFSGTNGDPDINGLIAKLQQIDYYQELFAFVFGDDQITERRMQLALAQFVRSIQSFDSRYDQGRAMVNNNNQDFPNFTAEENLGKRIFMTPPGGGPGGPGNNVNGAGCNGCHRAPEFDIDPNSRNNGVVTVAGTPGLLDVNVTRSPSLRDLISPSGQVNGPFMHEGSLVSLAHVIEHYNDVEIVPGNINLDPRLRRPGNQGQELDLDQNEKDALVAFLSTLSGNAVYTDEKWSNPFRN